MTFKTKQKTRMKQYIEKKTGRRVKAIQCLPGVQHSSLPPQFGEDTTQGSKIIVCDDARGEIGDWLVVCGETGKFQFFKPCVFPHHFVESSVAGKPKPEVQPEFPLVLSAEKQAALNFELALNELIQEHMKNDLTVTIAVGTLNLAAFSVAHNFSHKHF